MALSKITLKLGKKVIELTPTQFEELKADMRELDKNHHYYWHQSPWYSHWYANSIPTSRSIPITYGDSTGSITGMDQGAILGTHEAPDPFNGSILSAK